MKKLIIPVLACLFMFSACSEEATSEENMNYTEEDDTVKENGKKNEDAKKKCKEDFYASGGESLSMFDADKLEVAVDDFCDCSIENLGKAGIPVDDLINLSQEEINEHAGDCVTEFQGKIEAMVGM